MCKIKCVVEEGLIPREKIVRFKTADGNEEQVPLFIELVDEKTTPPNFHAYIIGRSEGKVLIELPNESATGRWRCVVNETELLEA
jgi:hypothetical protein